MSKLPKNEKDFIEKFVVFGTNIGLPRSVARVLGLLIITTPPEKTAADIRQRLDLSMGSTSTALAMLVDIRLVERVRKDGERTPYYRLVPNGLVAATERRLQTFRLAEEIADFGLESLPGDKRLVAMKKLYSFMDREMRDVLDKLKKIN